MGSSRLPKKKHELIPTKMSIPFNLLVISYLLICIIALFSSPTIASFHDTQTIEGKLTASYTFEESEVEEDIVDSDKDVEEQSTTSDSNQAEDEITDTIEQGQDNLNAEEDQQATSDSIQVKDETANTVEEEQDNLDAKEDQQSVSVPSESGMNESENEDAPK